MIHPPYGSCSEEQVARAHKVLQPLGVPYAFSLDLARANLRRSKHGFQLRHGSIAKNTLREHRPRDDASLSRRKRGETISGWRPELLARSQPKESVDLCLSPVWGNAPCYGAKRILGKGDCQEDKDRSGIMRTARGIDPIFTTKPLIRLHYEGPTDLQSTASTRESHLSIPVFVECPTNPLRTSEQERKSKTEKERARERAASHSAWRLPMVAAAASRP
jgi:hypothetical protein